MGLFSKFKKNDVKKDESKVKTDNEDKIQKDKKVSLKQEMAKDESLPSYAMDSTLKYKDMLIINRKNTLLVNPFNDKVLNFKDYPECKTNSDRLYLFNNYFQNKRRSIKDNLEYYGIKYSINDEIINNAIKNEDFSILSEIFELQVMQGIKYQFEGFEKEELEKNDLAKYNEQKLVDANKIANNSIGIKSYSVMPETKSIVKVSYPKSMYNDKTALTLDNIPPYIAISADYGQMLPENHINISNSFLKYSEFRLDNLEITKISCLCDDYDLFNYIIYTDEKPEGYNLTEYSKDNDTIRKTPDAHEVVVKVNKRKITAIMLFVSVIKTRKLVPVRGPCFIGMILKFEDGQESRYIGRSAADYEIYYYNISKDRKLSTIRCTYGLSIVGMSFSSIIC
ncbi:hypothetical protein B5S28_g4054 [[Candida] boidinii]|nr:hypothetical protein B5S28_g4054 [[Candida] boidinii]OWB63931.1 hypothetical protein B5S29_g4947 [[Candida] boidinii]OWB74057.1 hypothetical protein B5S31_g3831 [[Candida] boidinii]OWB78422.1 hypothetical protein B5S32_g2616 [[Candida] boidinii]GME79542.1 unnamed protein product [[Candida] boidinii]